MTSTRRFFITTAFATLALLAATGAAAQPSPQKLLIGKWRHVSTSHTNDGKPSPNKLTRTGATTEITADGKWHLVSSKNRSGGTYRWLDNERWEQTVVESGIPAQVGMVSVKRVRVTAERFEMITTYTRAELEKAMATVQPGTRQPNEMVITTMFERVGRE